ncbi:hypothetical protein BDC45DRAFT_558591 [Circinella umbellata]|nr:hypothetical protein BDC45DRAFT_558591 [Circinella umbellata]
MIRLKVMETVPHLLARNYTVKLLRKMNFQGMISIIWSKLLMHTFMAHQPLYAHNQEKSLLVKGDCHVRSTNGDDVNLDFIKNHDSKSKNAKEMVVEIKAAYFHYTTTLVLKYQIITSKTRKTTKKANNKKANKNTNDKNGKDDNKKTGSRYTPYKSTANLRKITFFLQIAVKIVDLDNQSHTLDFQSPGKL